MYFKWSGMKVACVAFVFRFLSVHLTFSCVFFFNKSGHHHHPLHISPFKERENDRGIGQEGVKDTVRSAD